jgi:hypothetical protein
MAVLAKTLRLKISNRNQILNNFEVLDVVLHVRLCVSDALHILICHVSPSDALT